MEMGKLKQMICKIFDSKMFFSTLFGFVRKGMITNHSLLKHS